MSCLILIKLHQVIVITVGPAFFPFFYFQLSYALLCACMCVCILVFFYEGNVSNIKNVSKKTQYFT